MATPFKKTCWKSGYVFALPLADGSFGIAQAIAPLHEWAVDLVLFSDRFATVPDAVPPLHRANVVSIHATWQRVLNSGRWAKVGTAACVIQPHECPNQKLLSSCGTGGAYQHSTDDGLQNFLSAYHGLIPWNLCEGLEFDQKLHCGVNRPKTARVLDEASLWLYRQIEQEKKYVI